MISGGRTMQSHGEASTDGGYSADKPGICNITIIIHNKKKIKFSIIAELTDHGRVDKEVVEVDEVRE